MTKNPISQLVDTDQTAAAYSVRDSLYQFMREVGCKVIFGNPGSTELPMFRNFPDDFKYVLGLQEACVVGMADGYAQATSNASFVNLHSAAGVGNAMGNIYTAFKNQTPMVIVAGQQARSIQPFDAYLHSRRATELPQPYVKFALEPARAEDFPLALSKAYKIAMQQPRGPVLLSVPSDDWDKPCKPLTSSVASTRVAPDEGAIAKLVQAVDQARKIALVVGASVDRDDAWVEAKQLAHKLRAAVFAAPLSARGSFPEDDPAFQGFLPGAGAGIRKMLHGFDLVLVIGGPAFTYHIERDHDGSHLPDGSTLALLTDDPEAAAAIPEGMAVYGSVLLGMRSLIRMVSERAPVEIPRRTPPVAVEGTDPISVAYVLQTLARLRAPADVIVEEAPTARLVMHQYLPITQSATFYTMASGGLGFGMPASVGIALAIPQRRVICVIGDGSSMYCIQSLWTAAQEGANVLFLVLNNRRYAAMKRFADVLGFQQDEKVVGIEIPGINYKQLADAQGCNGSQVTHWQQLEGALKGALESIGPSLVEVIVA